TLSRWSGSAIISGVSPTRLRRGTTGTPATSRRATARREKPPCAIGVEAKVSSEINAVEVPLLILEPPAGEIAIMTARPHRGSVLDWRQRTKDWRKVSSRRVGVKRHKKRFRGARAVAD